MTEQHERDGGLNLTDDLTCLYTDPTFHDVTIVCSDGVEIGANRAMLAVRSNMLRAMLYGRMIEATSAKVVLGEVDSAAMRVVLAFIHTDTIENTLPPQAAVASYCAAGFFLLPKLMKLVLKKMENIKDLAIASQLLNVAVVSVPPQETNAELYDILLKPFCLRSLSIGDLSTLSQRALEHLLTQTPKMDFKTPEHTLLLCVVDWAWSRSQQAPEFTQREQQLRYLNTAKDLDMPDKVKVQVRLVDKQSRASLKAMLLHLNLVLICPHRVKLITEAIDVVAKNSSQLVDFYSHYATTNTACPPNHQSRCRGKFSAHGEWDQSRLSPGRAKVTGDVVELSSVRFFSVGEDSTTVRMSRPFTVADGELHEWDIVIESVGLDQGKNRNRVGLIGEDFDIRNGAAVSGDELSVYYFESFGRNSYLSPDQSTPPKNSAPSGSGFGGLSGFGTTPVFQSTPFGATASQSTPVQPTPHGLFGATASPAQSTPFDSLFGSPPAPSAPQSTPFGSLFGAPPAPSTPQSTPHGGLFGAPRAPSGPQSTPHGGLFGAPPAPSAPQSTSLGGLFGATASPLPGAYVSRKPTSGRAVDHVLRAEDYITFHLNMKNRTCSLSINGKNHGIVFRNLPKMVYPAVILYPNSKYRYQPRL